MDRRINGSVGGSSHLFVQESRRSSRTEGMGKASLHPYKVIVWAGPCLLLQANIFMDCFLSLNVDGVRRCTLFGIPACCTLSTLCEYVLPPPPV